MWDYLSKLFQSDFMPHGHCFFWQPDILWIHVISDAVIGLSYYSIPLALVYLTMKRKELQFNWMFVMFAIFIFACGTTHFLGIWTIWHGTYRLDGAIKAMTALVSVVTAIALWPLIPKLLRIPSAEALQREIDERTQAQTELKKAHTELEGRVEMRTKELSKYARELERSNRELDQFAYVASHDLKAPLRAIHSLSEWVVQDASESLSEDSKKHLQQLQQRVERMERLLDDLLEYSRAGKTKTEAERIDTKILINDILEMIDPPQGFTVKVSSELPIISGKKVPLETVFRNLISNAFKHHDRKLGQLNIYAADKGEFVEFVVEDDGPGIPQQYHQRVFEMFRTLRPRDEVEGSGIGLAIVKKLIESQGGSIILDSDTGKGCRFKFTWPPASA